MIFKNIIYKDIIGNIEIVGKKIIFYSDQKSINENNCKIEIPINEINKEELKKELLKNNRLLNITIITAAREYEFTFGFEDIYNKFVNFCLGFL